MNITLTIDGKEYEMKEKKDEKKKGRWRAENGNEFWYVSEKEKTCFDEDERLDRHNWCYKTGNYFQTQEQVQKYLEYLNAMASVKEYIVENDMEFQPDWNNIKQEKYYVAFDCEEKELYFSYYSRIRTSEQLPNLSCIKHCKQLIKDKEKDLLTIFNYNV